MKIINHREFNELLDEIVKEKPFTRLIKICAGNGIWDGVAKLHFYKSRGY